jgi:hypothetical protein
MTIQKPQGVHETLLALQLHDAKRIHDDFLMDGLGRSMPCGPHRAVLTGHFAMKSNPGPSTPCGYAAV